MDEIITLVNTCGFPITICLFLLWFVKTEISNLREVIERNTIVMEKILTKLDLEVRNDV